MTQGKRICDVILVLIGLIIFSVPALFIVLLLLLCQGRPIFYLSKRMQTPNRSFLLCKFRTMGHSDADSGVSGGNKAARITPVGGILRRTRLDELPQLWNILCGDMSFVGPRPPLPDYVHQFPQLYEKVLQNRPGLTGLATLVFHKAEEGLLANCITAAETNDVYVRRCIPRKARLDLIYARKRSLLLDLFILLQTARQILFKSNSA